MRYLRYAFIGLLAICLITIALANREFVTLRLLPGEMAGLLGFSWSASLPLFLVVFLGIVAGLLIGFVWEWLREHKYRVEARHERRERERLEREVHRMRTEKPENRGDDVLALLEDRPATR